MKLNIMGKQVEMKTELVVTVVAMLALLGCLAGYLLFRDGEGFIIESGTARIETDVGNIAGAADGKSKGILPGADGAKSAGAGAVAGPESGSADVKSMEAVYGTAAAGSDNAVRAAAGKATTAVEQIKVYVVGCVKKPGIVTLVKGQVIDDAVRLAGGLTDEADAGSINMVFKLNENVMLYIKSKKELKEMRNDAAKSGGAGGPGKGAEIVAGSGSGVEIANGGTEIGMNSDGTGGADKSGMVNINMAGIAELDKLPGVGEATAREIIAYREKNGPFRKIEDIMKVPRIKQGRFDSIRDFICVN